MAAYSMLLSEQQMYVISTEATNAINLYVCVTWSAVLIQLSYEWRRNESVQPSNDLLSLAALFISGRKTFPVAALVIRLPSL